jgi:leucyl/phenylalanyl-tRNA--protein transferase
LATTTETRGPFWLDPQDEFPPPHLADEDGLLAVGADLEPDRLLSAYRLGIFPWPLLGAAEPILWWSPDPRFVLYPAELVTHRSLARQLRRGTFEVRFDTRFTEVIHCCARAKRPRQRGTWITAAMEVAYLRLHQLGYAHSVESYADGELVGGLYGVALGGVFFGESMFSRRSDASKVAFVRLVERLAAWGFGLIDCQQPTAHLARFGARAIPRAQFQRELQKLLALVDRRGRW